MAGVMLRALLNAEWKSRPAGCNNHAELSHETIILGTFQSDPPMVFGTPIMKLATAVYGRAVIVVCGFVLFLGTTARSQSGENYYIYVSNERSDNVSVIDGATREAVATIPVGKRPRGIHASPDGTTVYVAVSGTPPEPPPKLDANGNPIFQKGHDDDDDDKNADKAADGIAIIDVAQRKVTGKLPAGSDPENFAVSPDGKHLFISNEDVGTASVLNIASGKVEKIIPTHKEPEGVGIRPDGKVFFVTCETDGEIFAVDASTFKTITHFNVGGRPR
jgi:YVTN family beta-propeller protein